MKLNSGELNEKGPWENIIGHEYYIGVRVRESSNSCWPVGVTVPVWQQKRSQYIGSHDETDSMNRILISPFSLFQ